jgi:hypothetical protein
LCYLAATDIKGPFPELAGVEVRNHGHRILGRLDGIVIDPAARSLRYLVIDDERHLERHRYLLPLGAAWVDVEHGTLCVWADRTDLTRCEEFDADRFSSFSSRPRRPS